MDKETLLIVEDNHILRNGLKEILAFEGFTVITANNGRDALDHMKAFAPDLILSDISMPVMDGFAFFKAVREHPEWITIPFIFLTARGEREDMMAGRDLGAEDYLVKPTNRDELLTAIRSRLARSRQLQMIQLEQAYKASLSVLANAIEVRNKYTRGHVERVTAYSLALAGELGLQGKRLDVMRYGAILHDIGKIYVREAILNKSGRLSEEEWSEIRQHPVIGAELVKDIPYLAPAIPVILHHHERWDGAGYPYKLKGEKIPLEARIVSVADGFDAMTTERPYHPALSLPDAYREIRRCSGTQYDPKVVLSFLKAWEKGQIHAIAKNNLPKKGSFEKLIK
jgi:putative two-component system response regulator